MQEIERYKNGYGYDTFVIKTIEGSFEILFAPNGDLYWKYLSEKNVLEDKEEQELTITKENYLIYKLFYNLYESIKNNKIYYGEENYLEVKERENKIFKNDIIEWYSDELPIEITSKLTIKKEEETFKVIFEKSKKSQDGIFITYSIRFRNSGSRYDPFNICFMRMYNELKEYDLNYHQIHIEEYLYKQKTLKKEN